MVNTFTVTGVSCPDCGEVVITPDVWDLGKPISGPCPKCGDRLYWSAGSTYLSSFRASDLKEGEAPTCEVTIVLEPKE